MEKELLYKARVKEVVFTPQYQCRSIDTTCYARMIILETEDIRILLLPNPYDESIEIKTLPKNA